MRPKISIITVNYNGAEYTNALVDSLRRCMSVPYEVVVVDNGSVPSQEDILSRGNGEVKIVRSEQNLGFAGGNNLGLNHAQGEYLLLLNNDTFVEDDSLKYLVERIESSPNIGAVSPKIRFSWGDRHVQFAGYTPLTTVTLRNALIGFDQPDDGRWDTATQTPYCHGAAMLFRREALERAGRMTNDYFLYYEELDWSNRIAEAGFELWYEPRAVVYHHESVSTGKDSPMKVRYLTRNRLLFAKRNRQGVSRMASIVYQTCVAVPVSVARYGLKGEFAQSGAVLRGCIEFFSKYAMR